MASTALDADDSFVIDDRPIALRRKRRSSTFHADVPVQPKLELTDDCVELPSAVSKTPSKPKKKVRFSDPGPDGSGPLSSTGLTPALSRTSFDTYSPAPTQHHRPRRLASLPNIHSTFPAPSPIYSPALSSGEIQILPWCDVMDGRLKRRLKRNHLSEVQNEYEADRKPAFKNSVQYEQEIRTLRSELAALKKMQMHGEVEGVNSAMKSLNRERELEHEIVRLKQEMAETESGIDASIPAGQHTEQRTADPATIIDLETDSDHVDSSLRPEDDLENQAPIGISPQYAEMSTQASIAASDDLEMLRSTRLELEYMFPGEIALGLVPEDPQPLFKVMLERLDSLRTRTLIAEDSEATVSTQNANLRTQFNRTLEQLDRARKYSEKVGHQAKTEKTKAAAAEDKVTGLQASLNAASTRLREVSKDESEKERTISKLQEALESYRNEVHKLESLITDMDKEHSASMDRLRSDMDEAVADLECHVAAESTGRREAEAELEVKSQRIKELQTRERELKDAVNEKQRTIRNVEAAFTKSSTARDRLERENGLLNVQVNQLRHNLRNSDRRYEQVDQIREVLTRRLEEEQAASLRALNAVQSEVEQCSKTTGDIKSAHDQDSKKRSADALEHKGLLTPTTNGGRFRDMDEIEGMEGIEEAQDVEVQRGKKAKTRKRPDSGIVILEEDEDEEMAMH